MRVMLNNQIISYARKLIQSGKKEREDACLQMKKKLFR